MTHSRTKPYTYVDGVVTDVLIAKVINGAIVHEKILVAPSVILRERNDVNMLWR